MMSTIRQQMIALLATQEMNARDLSQALSITEKEVYTHLQHIDLTIARQRKKLEIDPCSCLVCGFVFDDRKRWNKPGRCPKCRNGRIRQAVYRVVAMQQ